MIPGTVSKMSEGAMPSAATIYPMSDIVKLTGTTQVNNVMPALGVAQCQFLVLIPVDGAIVLGTSGNILVGGTMPQNKVTTLIFVRSLGKWALDIGT